MFLLAIIPLFFLSVHTHFSDKLTDSSEWSVLVIPDNSGTHQNHTVDLVFPGHYHRSGTQIFFQCTYVIGTFAAVSPVEWHDLIQLPERVNALNFNSISATVSAALSSSDHDYLGAIAFADVSTQSLRVISTFASVGGTQVYISVLGSYTR